MDERESVQQPQDDEERLVCPACLELNHPEACFCAACAAPVGWFATIGPYESIFAYGFMYRRAIKVQPCRIVLVGAWLIGLPHLCPLLLAAFPVRDLFDYWAVWLPYAFVAAAHAVWLYRVTKSYLVRRRSGAASVAPPGDEDLQSEGQQ